MMLSERMADIKLWLKEFLPILVSIVRHCLVNLLTILFGSVTAIQLFLKKGLLDGSIH